MKHYPTIMGIAVGLWVLVLPGWAFRADDAPCSKHAAAAVSSTVATAMKPEVVRAPNADQVSAVNALPNIAVQWDTKTGAPASLRGAGLAEWKMGGKGVVFSGGRDYAQDAVAVLERLSAVYRINNAAHEFAVYRVDTDDLGFHHARLRQTTGGLRVIGGELIVHFDRSGQPYQVNGRYIPDVVVNTVPAIDLATAVVVAQRDLAAMDKPSGNVLGTPELVIYARDDTPTLAYAMTLVYADTQGGAGCWRYWIDAQNGAVINRFNDIRKARVPAATSDTPISGSLNTGEGGTSVTVEGDFSSGFYWLRYTALHWEIYDYPNSRTARNNSASWLTTISSRSEISAAYNFKLIQTYYYNVHNRNSYDNSGARATANVHVSGGTDNAYWDPDTQQFYFYPGSSWGELTVLDVCGHEFTHAVTENTADLIYQNESGALNESFSDIFGTLIEFDYQPDGRSVYPERTAGQADWLIGEDCTYPDVVALRDMCNPQRYNDPSKYRGTYWYYGGGDNGGVHYNCGVQNHMTYLLAEGGNGVNDGIAYDITGIGITNVRQVAYRALTMYCVPSTDYRAVRIAWLSAAQDLNLAWTTSVQAAWSAVGVYGITPPTPPTSTSNLCALGLNNDYDGDQCGDFTLYDTRYGDWHIWSSRNQNLLANGANFGSSNYLPVPGDYNGCGKSDALIYWPREGWWSVFYLENGMIETTTGFGGDAFIPVPGDYNGDRFTDFALYDTNNRTWYVLSARDRTWLVYGGIFGAPGFFPVPGDYDGDGRSDYALYLEATGDWYVFYAQNGRIDHFNVGGPRQVPVPGDYDGDGVSDFALYDYWYGDWNIYSPVAGWVMNKYRWGGSSCIPVSGDFDGDGVSDLVVYDRDQAEWFIHYYNGVARRLTNFGGTYMVPVVYWPLYGYM